MKSNGLLLLILLCPSLLSTPINVESRTEFSNYDLSNEIIGFYSNGPKLNSHTEIGQKTLVELIHLEQPIMDEFGNIWVSGYLIVASQSSTDTNAFLSKISPQGHIIWSKYYDGDYADYGSIELKFDSVGNVIFVMETSSRNFPVINSVVNSSQSDSYRSSSEVYIEKMTSDGLTIWSRYFGGLGEEFWVNSFLDENDNIYFHGTTSWPGTPVVDSWLNPEYVNVRDTFLVKLNPDGELQWSTLYGSEFGINDSPKSIYRGNGIVYLIGYAGGSDVLGLNTSSPSWLNLQLLEFNITSQELLYSGQFGGSSYQWSRDGAFDDSGNMYIVGLTGSDDIMHVNPLDNTLNGSTDGYVFKLDENKNITWSTYLGGSNNEELHGVYVDDNQNPVIFGTTSSTDLNVTDNSEHYGGGQDYFFTRIASDGSAILHSSYFGGSGLETRDWDTFEEGIMSIATTNMTLYSNGGLIDENLWTYPFNFGESEHGLIVEFNSESLVIERIITSAIVPHPDLDYDEDGLTNWEEYRLFVDDNIIVDPMNPDSDGDGLPDGWEIQFGLDVDDPIESSANSDTFDGDGLTNLQEYQFGTWPNRTDTDLDGMPDEFEFIHGLNGNGKDDTEDKDGDLMLNSYEFQYGFNASNPEDGNLDFDGDGVVNTLEFLSGTDPTKKDTDNDGIEDGYELKHGMDPLRNDLNEDSDGDLLPNELEFRLGLNPGSPIEMIIILSFLGTVVATITLLKYRSRRQNKFAKVDGFDNYSHKKQITKAGFSSVDEFEEAKKLGFLNKQSKDIVNSLQYDSVGQLVSGVDHFCKQIDVKFTQGIVNSKIEGINLIKTPIQLSELRLDQTKFHDEANTSIQIITDLIKGFNELVTLSSKNQVLDQLSDEGLSQTIGLLSILKMRLKEYQKSIYNALEERERWLIPWSGMLKLIQITEDNAPIPISDIMEVVNISEEHAIELITTLLEENSQFGTYNLETKIYKKSKESMLSDYLEKTLKAMEELQEE